ncbi:SPARC-related modular calcium-binding protein 1-like isoform X2 [Eriocheir sinensis]|uniref:SPARC-related modular calcium-binding protein 1-like isoform X2 n=1 Tax=Eriocheir sinensis TaxID=95602 RepID=UPI0021C84A87|nr:SPARC-related modular calcium-binding protein 1-like isoform X2 [Eriocheir sinensis]
MSPPREGRQEGVVVLLMAMILLLLPSFAAPQTGLNEESLVGRSRAFHDQRLQRARDQLQQRRVDCTVSCTHRSRGPVCGTNGRTYRSMCDLETDICRKVRVVLKHDGECSLEEKCMDERRSKQEEMANGENVYVPTCLKDGSYAPVQCHNFTLHCWCSRLDGKPIPETIQYNATPECPERCTGKSRRTFITKLSLHMVKEYQREMNTRKLSERRLLKRALKWKFSRLDRNRDQKLRRREYKRLRKTVRKFIKPKKCAKMFPKLCDADGDKSLTEKEWVTCFTNPGGKDRTSNNRCSSPPCRNRATTPKPSLPSCERNRQGALEAEHSSNISIPVLKCQSNGRYQPVQCLKDICICVDEWTGNSLDGTGVRNGTPDCSRPMPHARIWPGCTGETKTKFMQDLNKFLFSKVEGGNRNAGASSQSVPDFAARYHFTSLDTNNSTYLEGREKKMVKRHFKSNPKLRRCGRKMTTYCDVNYDKRISLEEWVACVTIQPNDTGEAVWRPDPQNPFETILKPEV